MMEPNFVFRLDPPADYQPCSLVSGVMFVESVDLDDSKLEETGEVALIVRGRHDRNGMKYLEYRTPLLNEMLSDDFVIKRNEPSVVARRNYYTKLYEYMKYQV